MEPNLGMFGKNLGLFGSLIVNKGHHYGFMANPMKPTLVDDFGNS